MNEYSMPRYFQQMEKLGETLFERDAENEQSLKEAESAIADQIQTVLENGKPTTDLNASGQLSAMQRIERMMDKVVEGFEKQLDLLFQGDAMDITTDVEVLERMLAKDGLSGQGGLTLVL